MEENIKAAQEGDKEAVAKIIKSCKGSNLMAEIRKLSVEIERREFQEFLASDAKVVEAIKKANAICVGFSYVENLLFFLLGSIISAISYEEILSKI